MDKASKEQNEKVKEWLWRYKYAKINARQREEEYQELVSLQESTGAIKYDDMPHTTNNDSDLSDLIIKRSAYLTRVIKAKKEATDIYDEIIEKISHLSSEQELILSQRYLVLNGCKERTWEEICDAVPWEWRKLHQIHSEGLKILRKMLDL